MLTKLLKKEFKLAMHPTVPIMLLLSCMVFIPAYPYSVIFFYSTLSVFFTCLQGRENNDVQYSMNLPIAKRDIVNARFTFVAIVEMAQIFLVAVFSIIKTATIELTNDAGMEANIVLIGAGFLLYGLFNIVFFGEYYRKVSNVGVAFVKASITFFVVMLVLLVMTHAVPYVKNVLDTRDPENLVPKIIVFAVGLCSYVVLTLISYKTSIANFEKQDI